jgi:hypothetical protein
MTPYANPEKTTTTPQPQGEGSPIPTSLPSAAELRDKKECNSCFAPMDFGYHLLDHGIFTGWVVCFACKELIEKKVRKNSNAPKGD